MPAQQWLNLITLIHDTGAVELIRADIARRMLGESDGEKRNELYVAAKWLAQAETMIQGYIDE